MEELLQGAAGGSDLLALVELTSEWRGAAASMAHWDLQKLAGQSLLARQEGRREVVTVPVDPSKRLPAF